MRIGVDVDGVLADFNTSFIQRCIDVTGKDLFPPRPFDIPTWDYPQHFGYTNEEADFRNGPIWGSVKADPNFWRNLGDYLTTIPDILYLRDRGDLGDEIYFITNRAGVKAKEQTEDWLSVRNLHEWMVPTVIVSAAKGLCAQALNLDVYIDDKWENCVDVTERSPKTTVYLMDRPWNRDRSNPSIIRTDRVRGIAG